MKTRDWQRLLTEQARAGKVLYTVTELANASGGPRSMVNVEMTRLVKYGVVVRYAHGLYGLADFPAPPEMVLHALDAHAYITGAYALMQCGLITQVPILITAFTTRRHSQREVSTPSGRIEFVCVRPPIYRREVDVMAGPELALCDFVYIALRRGMDPAGLVTFRKLKTLKTSVLNWTVKRYPSTVQHRIAELGGSKVGM